ncbi:adaptin N terminal region-domain-containing protein [Pterulicium gracile]|uniref:AP complex subunit beta n=1 Tax=Pterulicium gracile TaxID=1884261 RepID=A0A5C3QPU7_9AGAR|nr:adaptin N terminal region-domain-containing protein [Pterula gracilis]
MSALTNLSENASRLGMRLQEQLSEHTRDFQFTKSGASAYLDLSDEKLRTIRKQLDSSSDRDKLDAMKRLVALISKGRNVSEYFAQVVKNVASHNLEIRKLVYIFLLRYAEQEPDLALLSINTFQRDLTDSSPLIRSMALRVLSGIPLPMIGSIVVLGIKKCAADMSPYVRKAAALAIPRCHRLDAGHTTALIDIVSSLLRDSSPLSIGAVAVAFEAVCPTRLDLIHPHYRRLCALIVDVDEWGQLNLVHLLLCYARTMLPRPVSRQEEEIWAEDVDDDLDLLLRSSEPLLQSRNPAVVLAVCRLIYHSGVYSRFAKMVPPLLRLLHTSPETESVVLCYLLRLADSNYLSPLLTRSYTRFFICCNDTRATKLTKIHLLLKLANAEISASILREFVEYTDDTDDVVVNTSMRAIGKLAQDIPESSLQCFSALQSMIKDSTDVVVSSAVTVFKDLVRLRPPIGPGVPLHDGLPFPSSFISTLAYRLDEIKNSEARGCILWLVGQYAAAPQLHEAGTIDFAPDVLRRAVRAFMHERPGVKMQTLSLAAKMLTARPKEDRTTLMCRHLFHLARYDASSDVRDRCRMLVSLLVGVAPGLSREDAASRRGVVLRGEQVRLVLFSDKASTSAVVGGHAYESNAMVIGSMSVVLTRSPLMDTFLPDWLEQGTQPTLRGSGEVKPSQTVPRSIVSAPPKASSYATTGIEKPTSPKWTEDLDEFYSQESDTEEEATEEEEEEEEEEEDSSSDEGSTENESSEGERLNHTDVLG